jgi:hypothetical protein
MEWYFSIVRRSFLALLSCGCLSQTVVWAAPERAVEEVIARAVAHAQKVEAQPTPSDFTYKKVSVTEELDRAGKVRERREKVYQVMLQGGVTQAKLVEVNGRKPQASDLKKKSEGDISLRELLGQPSSSSSEGRDNFLTPDLVSRFQFALRGTANLNGRKAYEIVFVPKRPEPPVRRMADRLLNRISGTLWIDAAEFELARAELHLRSEVDLLGGIAGTLKRLAYTLVREKVAEGLWLNSYTTSNIEGRKFLDSLRIKTRSSTTGFRPLASNG